MAQMLWGAGRFMTYNKFDKSWPRVVSWLEALRENEAADSPVGTTGFCWGGKHVTVLCSGTKNAAGKNLVDAGFTGHPSRLDIPGDIDNIILPLSIAHASKDEGINEDQFKLLEAAMKKKQDLVDTEIFVYEGATHGFCVRADHTIDEGKHAVEAEDQAIKWFDRHFKIAS
jgi:dienelactone hydrolase